MDKHKPPTNFGVFKPVGHTVIAFRSPGAVDQAAAELVAQGFAASALVRYSGSEMHHQIAEELHAASPLANFGYELDLLRVHKSLAEEGCDFLIVHAPSDAQAATVAALVGRMKPAAAAHYGRFLIQDLTERAPG